MKKEKVVVICPGRGSYTQETLGYLSRNESSWVPLWDEKRKEQNKITLSELDGAKTFSPGTHLPAQNASSLIFACAQGDFSLINQDRYEVVAMVGNSMGWYIALGLAQALSVEHAFDLIETMGRLMGEKAQGGQVLYPVVDVQWRKSFQKLQLMEEVKKDLNLYDSIFLGGYRVLAGEDEKLKELMKILPKEDIYPLKLAFHGAYHTTLMESISEEARGLIDGSHFQKPKITLIDGRGKIWQPHTTHTQEIYEYTLGYQVVRPYDFTTSLKVAMKEFAPDRLVLLGPGTNLGGAIAQTLIELNFWGLTSKDDFLKRQGKDPILLSMGHPEQRELVINFSSADE